LGLSGQERPRSSKDLGEVKVSEWWNAAPDQGRLGTEGNSRMGRSGGGSGIEYESCRFLREALGK